MALADVVAHLEDPRWWRQQFPFLTLGRVRAGENPLDVDALATHRRRVVTEGYGQGTDPYLKKLGPLLTKAVKRCLQLGIPPTFIFLFDEPWAAYRRQRRFFAHLLGDDYRTMPDIFVWHIDPTRDEAGWSPHRDYGRKSLNPDGTPKSLQMWIPLNEATPLNGCMYVLPAMKDKHYARETELTFDFDIPSVRALPAKPGDFLYWNGAVIHWGAQSSRWAKAPRISMGLHFQRANERPLVTPLLDPLGPMSFAQRQLYVAKSAVQYRQRAPLPRDLEVELRRIARDIIVAATPL